MIARAAFIAARIVALAVFGLTWAYGVVASSSFAFDMFVKPQLSPALSAFVTWHPVWFLAAYLASALTLTPVLRPAKASVRSRAAQVLAIGYVLIMGAIALWMTQGAFLASIGSGQNRVLLVPGALIPVIWLALIDHLKESPAARHVALPIDQRGLWMALSSTAVLVWIAHAVAAWLAPIGASLAQVLAGSAWALLLDLALAQVAYVALAFASTAGGAAWPAYVISLCGYSGVVALFAEHLVLPTLGLHAADRALTAWPLGIAAALAAGGLRRSFGWTSADGVAALYATRVERRSTAIALAIGAVITGTWVAVRFVQFDWVFVLRQAIAVLEAAVAMSFMLAAFRSRVPRPWSVFALAGPALFVLAVVYAVPRLAAASGSAALEPQQGIEHAVAADPLARVAAASLLSRQPADTSAVQQLLDVPSAESSLHPKAPTDANTRVTPVPTPPNVFVIVLDSLRRDYLSPYNSAVSFTPAIDAWARESFVFRNALTPYGGTALAMPSLWAGRAVPHGWARILPDINRLEALVNSVPYDFALNDHTVREHLRPDTHYTFLNPFTASPQTDLCQNVAALEAHLHSRTSTAPVFAFLAPMNVHILNTRVGTGGESFPGFHAPYAAQLQRADACFGQFITNLKASGLYDRSIVVLTSDHGDSLGEDGRWGHQAFMYPEIVRIPLIISLPSEMRRSVTTDLGRTALLTDVTPTLMSLVGTRPVTDDLPSGSTLFVTPDHALRDRRRSSVMLMSSYGPVFGLLRRGTEYYMTDLQTWQESAFSLGTTGYQPALLTDARRRLSLSSIAQHIGLVARDFGGK